MRVKKRLLVFGIGLVCSLLLTLEPRVVAVEGVEDIPIVQQDAAPIESEGYQQKALEYYQQAGNESHKLMDRIKTAKVDELTRLVSNMLIAQIEDWCISDRLYKKLPPEFEKTVTKAKSNQYIDFDKDFGINLFDL